MSIITIDEMREAVKRAVDERGADYIYPKIIAWTVIVSIGAMASLIASLVK